MSSKDRILHPLQQRWGKRCTLFLGDAFYREMGQQSLRKTFLGSKTGKRFLRDVLLKGAEQESTSSKTNALAKGSSVPIVRKKTG